MCSNTLFDKCPLSELDLVQTIMLKEKLRAN